MAHVVGPKSENHKKYGYGAQQCKICGRHRGIIHKYGIELCRQCFRDVAEKMGWKKYN